VAPSLEQLRAYAVARTLFAPTTLGRAITRLGFVQADPIRAPARAQDLILRHRVVEYTAGDLDRRYPKLAIEEDFFVNYGFLPRATQALMHPRTARRPWSKATWRRAEQVLALVQERGAIHPREVEATLQHGKALNWFGGNSNATTLLLNGLHYRGLVRTVRREGGIRIYGPAPEFAPADPDSALDQLVDVIVKLYAPLPERSLGQLISYLGGGVPQWRGQRQALLKRTRSRLASAECAGTRWYWPADENPAAKRWAVAREPQLRVLAPFDPIVWDRTRFEMLWGWAYRFEAYTPAAKRVRGYYAMPLLWGDEVIGWANAGRGAEKSAGKSADESAGELTLQCGYVSGKAPRGAAFKVALAAEEASLREFLG
jgi:uncharacterized protein